jgi:hypothetical protein
MSDPREKTTEQRPPGRRRARWSWAVGEYGARVLVFEERNGRLYGRIHGRKVALGWPDSTEGRNRAKAWAKEQERQLREGLATAADPTPTLAKLFAAYRTARVDVEVSATSRYEDERCGGRLPNPEDPEDKGEPGLFLCVFGADRDASKLTLGEWQHFVRVRSVGAVDAWGRPVPEGKRRAVRARTVEADCEWLLKVFNWAMEWEDRHTNRPLLREHPLKRKRFCEAVPHEQNPRRPVASQDRFEKILEKAGTAHPFLPALLALVNGTGRRITAILRLRYEDLRLAKTKGAPYGAIAWPGETDKMGKAWSAPVNETVRTALDVLLTERPGVGAAYLFPAERNAGKPVDRWLASKWLEQAERLAEVPKQRGSLWHAYRRKWGTERKHLPIQDVAQAGGWKNAATLATIYQQPDEATLYAVVSQPAELREARA